jgi:hypothetical protein
VERVEEGTITAKLVSNRLNELEDLLSMETVVLARRAMRRTSTCEILMFAEWMR